MMDPGIPCPVFQWLHAICRSVGLPLSSHPDAKDDTLEMRVLMALLHQLENNAKEDLWLRAGTLVRPDELGVAHFALASQPTLRKGVRSLSRYLGLHSRYAALDIETVEDQAVLRLRLPPDPDGFLSRRAVEFFFAHLTHRLRTLATISPRRVTFQHNPVAYLDVCKEVFGVSIDFDQAQDSLTIDKAALDKDLPVLDETECRGGIPCIGARPCRVRQMIDRVSNITLDDLQPVGSISTEVRRILIAEVPRGIPPMTRVASCLGMTVPDLAAALRREGNTFAGLRESLLFRLVRAYLEDHLLAFVDVAFVTGFVEFEVFVATFARWSGKTPEAYRAGLRPSPV